MFAEPPRPELDGKSLTFLVGCYRSGTSLFQRLVNRHPDVSLMWECDVLRFLPSHIRTGWTERLDLWNGAIDRHGILPENLPTHGTREEAAIALYREYARKKQARVIGEKSPYYATMLRSLARRFPLAHFIIITRDPSDVLASVRKSGKSNRFFSKPWMPLRVLKDAGRLRRDFRWLQRRGHSVHHVPFESLVADPEAACKSVWNFLGLEDRRTELVTPDLSTVPEGEHHNNVIHSEVQESRVSLRPNDNFAAPYRTLWARRFALEQPGTRKRPSPLLLARDEAAYRVCLIHDQIARMAFRSAPLPVIRCHRDLTRHPVGRRHLKPADQTACSSKTD